MANTRRVPFRSKIVYKTVRGWTSGRSLPVKTLLSSFPLNYSSINLSKAVPSLCPLLLESTQKILLICTYLLWIPFAPGRSWFFPIGVYYLGTDDCTKMPGSQHVIFGVTVEPRYMEEPRDWQILFSVRRLRYFKVLVNKVLLLLW